MGRSVSYPRDSVVAFEDVSNFGMITYYRCNNEDCSLDGETFHNDEVVYDKENDCYRCSECGEILETLEDYDEFLGQDDYTFFTENAVYALQELFPSFEECDEWLDREDHAFAENSFAYFGISEYCGLASLWITPKDDCDNPGLAKSWVNRCESKFLSKFGDLKKIGTFSNGESIYETK